MPDYMDNPAGRLLMLFQSARTETPNTAAVTGWAKVFGVDENDLYALMLHAAEMVSLLEQTRKAVPELSDGNPEYLLRHLDKIETALSHFQVIRSVQMEQFLGSLASGEALYGLEGCAELLHRKQAELVLNAEQVTELIAETRDLIDNVLKSKDLDEKIRRDIVGRLHEVEKKLIGIQISGTSGLSAASDGLAGCLLRVLPQVGRHPIFVKCAALVTKLFTVTRAGNDALEMVQHIKEIAAGDE